MKLTALIVASESTSSGVGGLMEKIWLDMEAVNL